MEESCARKSGTLLVALVILLCLGLLLAASGQPFVRRIGHFTNREHEMGADVARQYGVVSNDYNSDCEVGKFHLRDKAPSPDKSSSAASCVIDLYARPGPKGRPPPPTNPSLTEGVDSEEENLADLYARPAPKGRPPAPTVPRAETIVQVIRRPPAPTGRWPPSQKPPQQQIALDLASSQ